MHRPCNRYPDKPIPLMKRNNTLNALLLSILISVALAACQTTPVQEAVQGESDPLPVPTIDTNEIVADVVATVAAQMPTPEPTAQPVDLEADVPLTGDLEEVFINLYDRFNPAVVHIFVFDQFDNFEGSGSGFVYDNDGHIVTNNHVVAGSEGLEVVFSDGQRRAGELVGTDIDSDLAVIRVDELPAGIESIPVGDSNSVDVGQFVVAIGNPFGEAGSMSVGIVSGLGRTLSSQRIAEGGGRYSLPRVIQTDAAINPGNSGGPLLNLFGEVVGVNSAIRTSTGQNSGVGFSIPSNAVSRIVPALIADGAYNYPFIGIRMTTLDLQAQERFNMENLSGAYVTDVSGDTPADRAGLIGSGVSEVGQTLPGGDLIMEINGTRITSPDDLISYLVFETTVGETVDLTVLRDGEEIVVPLTLAERP